MKVWDSQCWFYAFSSFWGAEEPFDQIRAKDPLRSSVGYGFIGHVNSTNRKPLPDPLPLHVREEKEKKLGSRLNTAETLRAARLPTLEFLVSVHARVQSPSRGPSAPAPTQILRYLGPLIRSLSSQRTCSPGAPSPCLAPASLTSLISESQHPPGSKRECGNLGGVRPEAPSITSL